MRTVALGRVAEIERDGIAPDKIQSGTPYLGLEHIESGGRILSFEPVDEGELASTKFRFGPDHVLYGKLRPYLAKIAMPDFEGICSTDRHAHLSPVGRDNFLPAKVGRKFLSGIALHRSHLSNENVRMYSIRRARSGPANRAPLANSIRASLSSCWLVRTRRTSAAIFATSRTASS